MHHLQGWWSPISGQELRYGFLRMVFQPCTLFCRIPALRWPLCPCLFLRRAETLLTAARQHSFELLQLFLQSLQLRVLGLVQRKQGIVFLGDLCVHVPKVQYPDGFYPVFWYLFLRFIALSLITKSGSSSLLVMSDTLFPNHSFCSLNVTFFPF